MINYHSRPIPGYEGIYEAHDDGTIWTVKNKITYRFINGRKQKRVWKQRQLKPKIEKRQRSTNYDLRVELWKNGKHKTYLVHRLIAAAFIPNPKNKPCVNHIDGNPLNDKPENLEWCTYKENQIDAFKQKLNKIPKSVQLGNKKFSTLDEASRWLNRNHGYISGLLKRGVKIAQSKNGKEFVIKQLF